jgi:hypothetical protein
MHAICYFFQASVTYLENYYPSYHFSVVLSLLTIFVYQSLILTAQDSIIEVQTIFAMPGCDIQETGSIVQWLTLEICGFYINLLVMIFFTINCHTNIKFLKAIYANKLILRCGIFQAIKKDKNLLGLEENIKIRIFDDHKDEKA